MKSSKKLLVNPFSLRIGGTHEERPEKLKSLSILLQVSQKLQESFSRKISFKCKAALIKCLCLYKHNLKYFFWKNFIWKETPSLNLEWETFTNTNLSKFTCITNQMLKMLLVMHRHLILLKTLQTILVKTVTKGWISISLENHILHLSTHSYQQKWILKNLEKILIFFLSLINLILEVPQVRYQCYNILQLIVLNLLQRC